MIFPSLPLWRCTLITTLACSRNVITRLKMKSTCSVNPWLLTNMKNSLINLQSMPSLKFTLCMEECTPWHYTLSHLKKYMTLTKKEILLSIRERNVVIIFLYSNYITILREEKDKERQKKTGRQSHWQSNRETDIYRDRKKDERETEIKWHKASEGQWRRETERKQA